MQAAGADGGNDSNAVATQEAGDPNHKHVHVQQQLVLSKDGFAVQIVRVMQVGPHENKVPIKIVDNHVHQAEEKTAAEMAKHDEAADNATLHAEKQGTDGTKVADPTLPSTTEDLKFMEEPRQEGDNLVIAEETKKVKIPQDRPVTTAPPTPPQSMFKQLFPSRNRYTILRDEL